MTRKEYRALLVDLDGTLLEIDMLEFIPAYVDCLKRYFADLIIGDDFARHLIAATNCVLENRDPDRSNETVFYDEFCRRLNRPYNQIRPLVERFYREQFPLLRKWSRPHPYAPKVIQSARRHNLILVLATNPLFPRTAVEQRLNWGGLSAADFDLITTIENMHFCKPHLEYYLEITRMIGCLPEQCLMAGNDVVEDLSAAEAGLDTFLVEDFILQRDDRKPEYNYRGTLKELAAFIDSMS